MHDNILKLVENGIYNAIDSAGNFAYNVFDGLSNLIASVHVDPLVLLVVLLACGIAFVLYLAIAH